MTTNDLLKNFSDILHQRNLSPVTIRSYLADARLFA